MITDPNALPARWLSTIEAARLLRVNRKTLDTLSRVSPPVPGGPLDVGLGGRRMLRWHADGLAAWLAGARSALDAANPRTGTR